MAPNDISILVVDDEEMISMLLKDYFEDCGFSVMSASSGAEALDILKDKTFSAAIVDMRLPDMVGDDLILRAHAIRPGIKYFIHTGSLDYQLPDELRSAGLSEDMIIHKPVLDMNTLYEAIMRQVG